MRLFPPGMDGKGTCCEFEKCPDTNADPLGGIVVYNNELYLADAVQSKIVVYNAVTMSSTPVRSWAMSNPRQIAVNSSGVWVIQAGSPSKIEFYSFTGVSARDYRLVRLDTICGLAISG